MHDRTYDELGSFPIHDSNPTKRHTKEGKKAVELAHDQEIEQIISHLRHQQSVLVVGDKTLAPYLSEECLPQRLGAVRWEYITYNAAPEPRPGGRAPTSIPGLLVQELAERLQAVYTATPPPVVVLRHLDLMTWTAVDQPRPELNDVVYWLTEFGDVVKLIFWDPVYALPKIIEDLFPNRVSLQIFSREVLWKLVAQEEARKISPSSTHFTLAAQLALYQYFSGTNVVNVRRILRGMAEQNFPDCRAGEPRDADGAFQYIRGRVSPSAMQSIADGGQVTGYEELRRELERQVLFPVQLRYTARDEVELQQADALVPRGVILYGPPGTGKTEWAKWLARELGATLLVIHGPELKHPLVGETEAAIRRIFAHARRTAPSLILIDELDATTPSRESAQSNFETSMVAQFLTEMDGLRKDEAVLVVGTTNRLEAVDIAFLRPSRFGVRIEVGDPEHTSREAILSHYNKQFALRLTGESIRWLVNATDEVLDPGYEEAQKKYHDAYVRHVVSEGLYTSAGPALQRQLQERFGLTRAVRFSGDHLRAICLYLLRESLYRHRYEPGQSHDVNDSSFLREAVEAVRKREIMPAGADGHHEIWGDGVPSSRF